MEIQGAIRFDELANMSIYRYPGGREPFIKIDQWTCYPYMIWVIHRDRTNDRHCFNESAWIQVIPINHP